MLKRMTIGKRIVFGFMSMIAQLVLVAFIGYNGIRETITGMDGIVCHPEVAKKANTILADAQDARARHNPPCVTAKNTAGQAIPLDDGDFDGFNG